MKVHVAESNKKGNAGGTFRLCGLIVPIKYSTVAYTAAVPGPLVTGRGEEGSQFELSFSTAWYCCSAKSQLPPYYSTNNGSGSVNTN